MYEKLTKCPNFTRYLHELCFPKFGGKCPAVPPVSYVYDRGTGSHCDVFELHGYFTRFHHANHFCRPTVLVYSRQSCLARIYIFILWAGVARRTVFLGHVTCAFCVCRIRSRIQTFQGPEPIPVSRQLARWWHGHKTSGRLPLLSCRPAITFPAAEHRRPSCRTKFYCLLTDTCVNNLPRVVTWQCNGYSYAASGGQTVLANDRNGGRFRLIATRHDDDECNGRESNPGPP